MFTHSFETLKFPCTFYETDILLVLKEDETDPSSFHPIALLNMTFFTKLANNINKYISSIIHADQTGVVPIRLYFLISED